MENLIHLVENAIQRADRAKLTDTSAHRAAVKAAIRISSYLYTEAVFLEDERFETRIAAIVFDVIREEREL